MCDSQSRNAWNVVCVNNAATAVLAGMDTWNEIVEWLENDAINLIFQMIESDKPQLS